MTSAKGAETRRQSIEELSTSLGGEPDTAPVLRAFSHPKGAETRRQSIEELSTSLGGEPDTAPVLRAFSHPKGAETRRQSVEEVSTSLGGEPDAAPVLRGSFRRPLEVLDLGRMRYADALRWQQRLVDERKRGQGVDTLLFVEHPHVVTMGRNGKEHNVLASGEVLARAGIDYFETDRGGDVTYHGPGQLVGYPILDLREWKRDIHAYFDGIERCLIAALDVFGIAAQRIPERGHEGVWVRGAKIAAIGIHISRWITSHGFALNVETDLSYFKYIVPCGLTKPVCSLRSVGCNAGRGEVMSAVATSLANVFDFELVMAQQGGLAASTCTKGLQETR